MVFIKREHNINMNKKEDILQKAAERLREIAGIEIKWHSQHGREEHDIVLFIAGDKHREKWVVQIKNELRPYHLTELLPIRERHDNLLLIARLLSPQLRQTLREHNIAYLDLAGNAYIKSNRLVVFVEGQKSREPKSRAAPANAFTKSGMRVIFLFLLDERLVNATYREIAGEAQVALGIIPRVMDGLKQSGHLLKIDEHAYKLARKQQLLQRWMTDYAEKLKSSLHVGNFRFANGRQRDTWQRLELDRRTLWGGEAAADILTQSIRPAILTLYTEETRAALMKRYHFIPDEAGDVCVYRKFWPSRFDRIGTVPPVLVYTDLVNSGDARNIEVARAIHASFLDHLV